MNTTNTPNANANVALDPIPRLQQKVGLVQKSRRLSVTRAVRGVHVGITAQLRQRCGHVRTSQISRALSTEIRSARRSGRSAHSWRCLADRIMIADHLRISLILRLHHTRPPAVEYGPRDGCDDLFELPVAFSPAHFSACGDRLLPIPAATNCRKLITSVSCRTAYAASTPWFSRKSLRC
jgi:hypothetical protein